MKSPWLETRKYLTSLMVVHIAWLGRYSQSHTYLVGLEKLNMFQAVNKAMATALETDPTARTNLDKVIKLIF